MRPPGSQPRPHQRPRHPILRSPDSTPPQILRSPLRQPHSAAALTGTRYAQLLPRFVRVRSLPVQMNLLLKSSFLPLCFSVPGANKNPTTFTLRNPHSTVKALKLSNLTSRMKMLDLLSLQTDPLQQGGRMAQAKACATGPLAHCGLQFSCAASLTDDSREGPVFRPA